MVGEIADRRLAATPAGQKLKDLLDGMTLEEVSIIPDSIKGWDKNGPDDPGIFHYTAHPRIDAALVAYWKANPPTYELKSPIPSHHWFHYTDVPLLGDEKYADGKVGRSQWDIVHMITYCVDVLTGATPEDNPRKITKPIAIILLAHFVGDIHQPLHVRAEYFDSVGKPINPDVTPNALPDQGGNTIMLHLPMSLVLAHKKGIELLRFWDTDAVMANLPELPDTMQKDERRAKMDAAEAALVKEMAALEPKAWREPPNLPLTGYAEAWGNDILPLAREAHARLQFSNIRARTDGGEVNAGGDAEGRNGSDGVDYKAWAAKVVRMEIQKGGWRLADLLQKALDPAAAKSPAAPVSTPTLTSGAILAPKLAPAGKKPAPAPAH